MRQLAIYCTPTTPTKYSTECIWSTLHTFSGYCTKEMRSLVAIIPLVFLVVSAVNFPWLTHRADTTLMVSPKRVNSMCVLGPG